MESKPQKPKINPESVRFRHELQQVLSSLPLTHPLLKMIRSEAAKQRGRMQTPHAGPGRPRRIDAAKVREMVKGGEELGKVAKKMKCSVVRIKQILKEKAS